MTITPSDITFLQKNHTLLMGARLLLDVSNCSCRGESAFFQRNHIEVEVTNTWEDRRTVKLDHPSGSPTPVTCIAIPIEVIPVTDFGLSCDRFDRPRAMQVEICGVSKEDALAPVLMLHGGWRLAISREDVTILSFGSGLSEWRDQLERRIGEIQDMIDYGGSMVKQWVSKGKKDKVL